MTAATDAELRRLAEAATKAEPPFVCRKVAMTDAEVALFRECGGSTVLSLLDRLAAAEADVREREEDEAACCPEDVSFRDYIAHLTKRAESAEARVAALEAERDAARAEKAAAEERAQRMREALHRGIDLLDRALGDTDPAEEPDEHEDPTYHAMRALTAALAEPAAGKGAPEASTPEEDQCVSGS